MATHSSVLAWRIPGTAEPGGLPSMESHRVGHDWSKSAATAAGGVVEFKLLPHLGSPLWHGPSLLLHWAWQLYPGLCAARHSLPTTSPSSLVLQTHRLWHMVSLFCKCQIKSVLFGYVSSDTLWEERGCPSRFPRVSIRSPFSLPYDCLVSFFLHQPDCTLKILYLFPKQLAQCPVHKGHSIHVCSMSE